METDNYRCGYVAIVGRPNVGKSTLLNHLLAQKISITSRKPQTTRHRLLGIKTEENAQIVYVDTPGIHQDKHTAMNRYLNRTALGSLDGVDLIVWLVEALVWTEEDAHVLNILESTTLPVILGVNKVDKVANKESLLPYLEEITQKRDFLEVFPLSALRGVNLTELEEKIIVQLPLSPPLFPADQVTDRSERFFVAEMIREKLVRRLGAELPYRLSVQIEHFAEEEKLTHISAIIWVEREGQKAIVIGKQGHVLKKVGEEARKDIEVMLAQKVFLQLWVKVKQGWHDDDRALRQLGYSDD
ncbi:GTPase Era [Beggiatoa leptomitoformis]|uniref:GTPase Era n=1 Tax=Beggiatoa leptomitoformis TaxID=288004 RepID=A0A2N9YC05_9GAMM|nr:GTPase Era [Beggiatoa leptomitoformis]ALG66674.1 GTPase Era [Beggiatoa leptomitoformis]AUI68000.1 GTPase Era [Beggiatoa leptomitoformis]